MNGESRLMTGLQPIMGFRFALMPNAVLCRDDGVVEFACGTSNEVALGILIKPKAERLSPHQEETLDELSAYESSSVHSRSDEPVNVSIRLGENEDDQASPGGDDDKSRGADDKPSVDSDDSESEAGNANKEPSILPQRSILHETESPPGRPATSTTTSRRAYDTSSKAKRVLSSNTLADLNAEAGHKDDSPKRMRTSPDVERLSIDDLPELTLGLSVMDSIQPLPSRYSLRRSPIISIDYDEGLDLALSEELKRSSNKLSGDKSPVPLLTPPQSPLPIPSEQDNWLVEWPSNLVIDSAMMSAATDTRALSPSSLEKFDEDEEIRLKDAFSRPEPSTLTPLLRSIYVGTKQ
jgi:hypothetical protein